MPRVVPFVHPGELLLRGWLDPLNFGQHRLFAEIDVPPRRIQELVPGQRAITADTAGRIGAYLGVEAESWLTGLKSHDEVTPGAERRQEALARIVPFQARERQDLRAG